MSEDNHATEWWWIDYLENEMDPGLDKDLELLLQHSQEDRDSFEHFRVLKLWLRASDPTGDWPVEERCKRLRGNVMEAIQQLEKEKRYPALNAETKSLSV